jgi:hypothetical protein
VEAAEVLAAVVVAEAGVAVAAGAEVVVEAAGAGAPVLAAAERKEWARCGASSGF